MLDAWSPASQSELVKQLRDLVVALDQRVPHVERTGEAAIARDAQALRTKALRRIAEIEAGSRADTPATDS
jgi:hypothetical protein